MSPAASERIKELMKKLRSTSKNSYEKLPSATDHHQSSKKHRVVARIPKGHLALYVGSEENNRRPYGPYLIPLNYFCRPDFQEFIVQSQPEYVYDLKIEGPIVLSCTTDQLFDKCPEIKIAN